MAGIRLEGIEKTYPNGERALRGIDLEVEDGELLVLVGPSGCGKTTALRIAAGLEAPTVGRVWIGNRDVTEVAPAQRDIAMVFQSYALYPHKTVRENLAFGLRMRRLPSDEIRRRVDEAAERLELASVLERRPAELSGGQRQRVALGRALVREPAAFLLDEPLSNLDARLRVDTRAALARLHRRLGATMLYVTHDQEEAMMLGDRIAVMREGRLEQVGPPLEIYRRPATVFAADFVGSPSMNWFAGALASDRDPPRVLLDGFELELPTGAALPSAREVRVGIRPTDVELSAPDDADLHGRVEVVEATGSAVLVHVAWSKGLALRVQLPAHAEVAPGDPVALRLSRTRLHFFDATTERRLD